MESDERKKKLNNVEEDRISKLPNQLLHRILTYLEDMNEVVKTCVLSKRWRDIWSSVPDLQFDFDSRNDQSEILPFVNFINQVLLRRDCSPIVSFSYHSSRLVDASLVEPMIHYALKHQVQDLFIHAFCRERKIELPVCFYSSQSLTTVTLENPYDSINLPRCFGLPSLKKLCLEGFCFDGHVLSTCLNLEILELANVHLPKEKEAFTIHSPNLKSLKFNHLELITRPVILSPINLTKVVIFAPKLAHFRFSGHKPLLCSAENIMSLDKLSVDMRTSLGITSCQKWYDKSLENIGVGVINMLNEFNNTKSISLSSTTVELLAKVPDELCKYPSQFPSLKYLKLKGWHNNSYVPRSLFTYFLNSSTLFKVQTVVGKYSSKLIFSA